MFSTQEHLTAEQIAAFQTEFDKILRNEDEMLKAFRARASIEIDKTLQQLNLTREQLTAALTQLDKLTVSDSGQEVTIVNGTIGKQTTYTIYLPERVIYSIKAIGFTNKEINSMAISDILKIDAAIFKAQEVLLYTEEKPHQLTPSAFYLKLLEKEDSKRILNEIVSDLQQSARPLIIDYLDHSHGYIPQYSILDLTFNHDEIRKKHAQLTKAAFEQYKAYSAGNAYLSYRMKELIAASLMSRATVRRIPESNKAPITISDIDELLRSLIDNAKEPTFKIADTSRPMSIQTECDKTHPNLSLRDAVIYDAICYHYAAAMVEDAQLSLSTIQTNDDEMLAIIQSANQFVLSLQTQVIPLLQNQAECLTVQTSRANTTEAEEKKKIEFAKQMLLLGIHNIKESIQIKRTHGKLFHDYDDLEVSYLNTLTELSNTLTSINHIDLQTLNALLQLSHKITTDFKHFAELENTETKSKAKPLHDENITALENHTKNLVNLSTPTPPIAQAPATKPTNFFVRYGKNIAEFTAAFAVTGASTGFAFGFTLGAPFAGVGGLIAGAILAAIGAVIGAVVGFMMGCVTGLAQKHHDASKLQQKRQVAIKQETPAPRTTGTFNAKPMPNIHAAVKATQNTAPETKSLFVEDQNGNDTPLYNHDVAYEESDTESYYDSSNEENSNEALSTKYYSKKR